MSKQGLILAAGFGSRLGDKKTLKPLVEINGKALIIRTLETLNAGGCDSFVIVLGYEADTIEEYVRKNYSGPAKLQFAYNKLYSLNNGLSVIAATHLLRDNFVLSMADHLFSEQIPYLLSHTPFPKKGAALFVDYKIDSVFDLDDATKVLAKNHRVIDIGKKIESYNCIDTGLFLCTRDLVRALEQIFQQKGDASLSAGISALANSNIMYTIDIGNACWQDVDDAAMLEQGWNLIRNCESDALS